ncbi:hypothetical protein FKO01_04060 [Mesorhizobium sp. B2-3-3]|nr:hypothetical protein FKO01_04060 [Mesorhizobium sp. B2-3-3]
MVKRRASDIVYSQATMFSPDANVRPPSSDRWKEVEAERLEKLGKPGLVKDYASIQRSLHEQQAQERAEAERLADELEERRKQERVERAMNDMFPGRKARRRNP